MKKIFFTLAAIALISFNSFGQNTGFKSVEDIDSYIQAVEIKIEHVKNNPEQKKIAEEEGWFEQMDANIQEAKKQREILLGKKEE